MAIIKCPECGHQVSDKAPTCPNCGVEIAGKTLTCGHCGQVYLADNKRCPNCDKQKDNESTKKTISLNNNQQNGKKRKKENKNSLKPYITTIIIALLLAGGGLYVIKNNRSKKELSAYELAMKSSDYATLRNFLNNFADAPQEHIDSIQARLDMLNMIDEEWENVKATRSKKALQDYIIKYPDTKHKAEIENLLDSIDWQQALASNNNDMFQQYINDHPYGSHAEEAREKINELKAKTVQTEERQMIAKLMRKFFLSVNKRDEAALTSTLSPLMTSFLGVQNPTDADVRRWMNKLYKNEQTEIIWKLNNDYNINKREVGDNAYEYTVVLTASEEVKNQDDNKSAIDNYKITTTVSPDGLITAMSMSKLLAE